MSFTADPWFVSDITLSVVGRVTGNVITLEEMSLSDAWCLPSVDNTWRGSRRNLTMLKWDWRRVDFPQWLSVLICLAITEICDGLHLSTTTTHASTSELEPLTWNSRTRSPGNLWFRYIHPWGQGSLLLTFNCFEQRMWHLCPSSLWKVYVEVLIDPAQWLISPLDQPPDALLFYVVWWTKTFIRHASDNEQRCR